MYAWLKGEETLLSSMKTYKYAPGYPRHLHSVCFSSDQSGTDSRGAFQTKGGEIGMATVGQMFLNDYRTKKPAIHLPSFSKRDCWMYSRT